MFYIKKWMNLTCKEATFLMSKKQESRLSLLESLKLKYHLALCDACTRFEKQVDVLNKSLTKHLQNPQSTKLSDEKKQSLRSLIDKHTDTNQSY